MKQFNLLRDLQLRNFVPAMKMISSISLIVMIALVSCTNRKGTSELSPDAFREQLTSGTNIQLVDTRSPKAYEEGHIAQAVNIDFATSDFDKKIEDLYKDIPVYVYGQKGGEEAAAKLRSLGFKEVYQLKGGMDEWMQKGQPVEMGFNTVIAGKKLVLVDFNAKWCKPCKMMQPFIDKIHEERKNDVIVMSIDTDMARDLAMKYEVSLLPTVMMFKENQVIYRSEGLLDQAYLDSLVDHYK